jgi:DNA-binding MurR/RpiR family transcriptional regulator
MNYETLLDQLKTLMPTLPPQLQRAAVALESRADDVALLSMRELAVSSGLSPSTFTRLARALGFDDYAALRNVVVQRIRTRGQGNFSREAQKYIKGSKGKNSFANRAHDLHQSITENVRQAYSESNLDGITQAAELLSTTRRVFLLGSRSCVSLTLFFNYASQLFSDKVSLHAGLAEALNDGLRFMKKNDVVLAFTFEPYTRIIGDELRKASATGAKIIMVTDGVLAPNAELATVLLTAPVATASFFHSLAAPLALVDALLLAWLQKEGKSALTQIEKTDRQLQDDGVYLRSRKSRAELPS